MKNPFARNANSDTLEPEIWSRCEKQIDRLIQLGVSTRKITLVIHMASIHAKDQTEFVDTFTRVADWIATDPGLVT